MNVCIIAALTADGFIGRDSRHLADWTGKADKQLFADVTKRLGVVVMGSRTFATIGRALPGRRNIMYTSRPEANRIEGVETTSEAPAALLQRLQAEGAGGAAICGGASIYSLFMAAGLVDELYLTIAPKLFGSGVPLFGRPLDVQLQLAESRPLDEHTILLHYRVVR